MGQLCVSAETQKYGSRAKPSHEKYLLCDQYIKLLTPQHYALNEPPPPPPECHLNPDPECLLVRDITADCYDKLLKVSIETHEHYNNVMDILSRSKEGDV